MRDLPGGSALRDGRPDILDDPDALRAADTSGALIGAASGGAQVRAVATAVSGGALDEVRGLRPRALVWIVGRSSQSAAAAGVVSALLERYPEGSGIPLHIGHVLPGWVGALDIVLVSGADAGDPIQADALARARARGAAVVADLPNEGPAADAGSAGGIAWLPPLAFVAPERAFLRHVAAGLGVVAAVLGGDAEVPLGGIADEVDAALAAAGPDLAVPVNPAKLFAGAVAEAPFPQIVFEDAVAGAVGRRIAQAFTEVGVPLTAAPLADALRVAPLLAARSAAARDGGGEGPASVDDLFHDELIDGPRPDTPAPTPTNFGLVLGAPRARVELLAAALGSVSWIEFDDADDSEGAADAPEAAPDFRELVASTFVVAACGELSAAYASLVH